MQGQIDKVTNELDMHQHKLLIDIKSLDVLYEKTLTFYDELALYIAAGEAKLAELDATTIPAKEAEVKAAPEDDQVMDAQELRDLRAARDDLERRVYDLKLTRQVTMQSLPSIRLVQENDKSLVTKINSTLVNTVPLWETQLAQAVTIQRSREAAEAVKAANDLTNELLTANAQNLQDANRVVRQQIERGVFDIEAVQKANDTSIATINESLQIADEGRARRADRRGPAGQRCRTTCATRSPPPRRASRRGAGDRLQNAGADASRPPASAPRRILAATALALLRLAARPSARPCPRRCRTRRRACRRRTRSAALSADSAALRVYYARLQAIHAGPGPAAHRWRRARRAL